MNARRLCGRRYGRMRGEVLKKIPKGSGVHAEARASRAGRASSSDTHHFPWRLPVADHAARATPARRRRSRGRLLLLAGQAERSVPVAAEQSRTAPRTSAVAVAVRNSPARVLPARRRACQPGDHQRSHQPGTERHGPGATAYELAASAVLLDAEAHPDAAKHPASQLEVPPVVVAATPGGGRQPAERRLDELYPCRRRAPALAPDARRTWERNRQAAAGSAGATA